MTPGRRSIGPWLRAPRVDGRFPGMGDPGSHNPLRDGNRFQRAYYRWALPHYERIESQHGRELREQVESTDRFLYTRQGAWAWIGWLVGLSGTAVALSRTPLPMAAAWILAAVAWTSLAFTVLGAWLRPQLASGPGMAGRAGRLLVMVVAGGFVGYGVGHWIKTGSLDPGNTLGSLLGASRVLLPALGVSGLGMALLFWAVGRASSQVQARRLEHARLLAERDAARASAAEAELRILQAQLEPHFVFNTLATLQHWVDKGDSRAGPLLRALSGFLRATTEMLGRKAVPLEREMEAVTNYIAILQARYGDRLGSEVRIDPQTLAQPVPPGLVLTLVENAIEHGLEPKISGGTVRVSSGCGASGWWLQVDDDGMGVMPHAPENVGLSNLRQRLLHQCGGRARFSLEPLPAGGSRARVEFEERA